MWSHYLVYLCMVSIELLFIFSAQHLRDNSIQVDGYVSDRLEVEELSVFVLFPFAYHQLIFGADTVGTFDVDTRLIGDDKARHQRLFLAVADSAAETAGSLMDVHQIPYTVSGAMVKVFTPFPCGHSCQHVQVVTRSSFQEHGACQMHVALENSGKVFLHFLSQVAESKGTGDVCRAFDISAAGVS